MNTSPKPTTSSRTTTTTENHTSPKTSQSLFLREQAFARVKASKSQWSARDVVNEALRIPGHCGHVESPSAPIIHHGVGASQLQSWLDDLETKSQSVKVETVLGLRRQRSDSPILMCVVVSHPKHPRNRNDPDCVDWRTRTIAWIRNRYGDRHIACILEHDDEGHQHLHVLVHNDGASVKPLMAGEIAVARARSAGVPKSELGTAYKVGCKDLLDSYWREVGSVSGLSRQSPAPRPRVKRKRHIAQRERELDDAHALAQLAKEQADMQATEWTRKQRDLVNQKRLLDYEQAHAQTQTKALQDELTKKLATATELLRLLTPEEIAALKRRVGGSRPRA